MNEEVEKFINLIISDEDFKRKFLSDPGICRQYGISPAALPAIMAKILENP